MKRLILLFIFVFIYNFIFAQNSTSGNKSITEEERHIAKKWSMITQAGFGYDLIFNNESKTFSLSLIDECTFPIRPIINGKFKISDVKNQTLVTLIFNDFTIDYYFKYPRNSACSSSVDKLTKKELKYFVDLDSNGYPANYVMIIKEVKIINRRDKWPQYYEDLVSHCFEYSEKNDYVDDSKVLEENKNNLYNENKKISDEDQEQMKKALEEATKGLEQMNKELEEENNKK